MKIMVIAPGSMSQEEIGHDFAEVHDCFTIVEILRVECLGLCERGGMIKGIEDGTIEITGKKPINLSGGLIGKGHPIGCDRNRPDL